MKAATKFARVICEQQSGAEDMARSANDPKARVPDAIMTSIDDSDALRRARRIHPRMNGMLRLFIMFGLRGHLMRFSFPTAWQSVDIGR